MNQPTENGEATSEGLAAQGAEEGAEAAVAAGAEAAVGAVRYAGEMLGQTSGGS